MEELSETKIPTNSTSKDETPSENVKYIWFGVYNELLLNEKSFLANSIVIDSALHGRHGADSHTERNGL